MIWPGNPKFYLNVFRIPETSSYLNHLGLIHSVPSSPSVWLHGSTLGICASFLVIQHSFISSFLWLDFVSWFSDIWLQEALCIPCICLLVPQELGFLDRNSHKVLIFTAESIKLLKLRCWARQMWCPGKVSGTYWPHASCPLQLITKIGLRS